MVDFVVVVVVGVMPIQTVVEVDMVLQIVYGYLGPGDAVPTIEKLFPNQNVDKSDQYAVPLGGTVTDQYQHRDRRTATNVLIFVPF